MKNRILKSQGSGKVSPKLILLLTSHETLGLWTSHFTLLRHELFFFFFNGGIGHKVTIITYVYLYIYTGAKGFTCMSSLCVECYFPNFIGHIASV